jgi:recombinational DNA repair protein RecT
MFEIEAFQNNWVSNYKKTTGKDDGMIMWERNRVEFLSQVANNPKLQECNRMSLYMSFTQLGASGLTLSEGMSGIIPYKDKAQFQIFANGRREQLSWLPHIKYVNEPVVVREEDVFEYEAGDNLRVIKHQPKLNSKSDIIAVYMVLDTVEGKKTYLMSRDEVLSIRDNYSQTFKSYEKKVKDGSWKDWMDAPIWVSNEAEAFKKTIVKRVWKVQPNKSARLKQLEEFESKEVDQSDISTEDIDYGLVEEPETTEEPQDEYTEAEQVDNNNEDSF